MRVFVSYARADQDKVGKVVEGLRLLGREAWFDEALVGGQAWWDGILARVRDCDVFVQTISRAVLNSEACERERTYALALGKQVLPVRVESVPTTVLPEDLAARQFVDYTDATSESAFRLAAALEQCPPTEPLPEPLPDPPPIPVSYLGKLGEDLRAPQLSKDQQLALVSRLRSAAEDPEQHEGAMELLHRMQQRDDLFADTDRAISSALQISPPAGGGPDARWADAGPGVATSPGESRTAPDPGPEPLTPSAPQSASAPLPAAPQVKSNMGLAIVGTFLFFPVGLFAIIDAARVGPALERNDHARAAKLSSRARILSWISIGLFVLLLIVALGSNQQQQY